MSYDDFSALPNEYNQVETSAFNPDGLLYDLFLTEAYNREGIDLTFYITTYNTETVNYPDSKALFGEDNDRSFVRKFNIKAYLPDLPKELQMISIFGIEGLDNFKIHISKRHFTEASQVGGFDEYIPSEGDIVHFAYNNRFYSLTDVGQEEEVFLQRKHSWEFTLERFKDTTISLTSATSADMPELIGVTDIDRDEDIFNISDYITSASEEIKYPTSADEDAPSSIWGSWA